MNPLGLWVAQRVLPRECAASIASVSIAILIGFGVIIDVFRLHLRCVAVQQSRLVRPELDDQHVAGNDTTTASFERCNFDGSRWFLLTISITFHIGLRRASWNGANVYAR